MILHFNTESRENRIFGNDDVPRPPPPPLSLRQPPHADDADFWQKQQWRQSHSSNCYKRWSSPPLQRAQTKAPNKQQSNHSLCVLWPAEIIQTSKAIWKPCFASELLEHDSPCVLSCVFHSNSSREEFVLRLVPGLFFIIDLWSWFFSYTTYSHDAGLFSLSLDLLLQPLVIRQCQQIVNSHWSTALSQEFSRCRPETGRSWVQPPAGSNQGLSHWFPLSPRLDSVFRVGLELELGWISQWFLAARPQLTTAPRGGDGGQSSHPLGLSQSEGLWSLKYLFE